MHAYHIVKILYNQWNYHINTNKALYQQPSSFKQEFCKCNSVHVSYFCAIFSTVHLCNLIVEIRMPVRHQKMNIPSLLFPSLVEAVQWSSALCQSVLTFSPSLCIVPLSPRTQNWEWIQSGVGWLQGYLSEWAQWCCHRCRCCFCGSISTIPHPL